jgi:hypothetical protein
MSATSYPVGSSSRARSILAGFTATTVVARVDSGDDTRAEQPTRPPAAQTTATTHEPNTRTSR